MHWSWRETQNENWFDLFQKGRQVVDGNPEQQTRGMAPCLADRVGSCAWPAVWATSPRDGMTGSAAVTAPERAGGAAPGVCESGCGAGTFVFL